MFTDSGKNYSCYETKIRVLSEDWEFAELSKGYDHLWDEAMGKEGSSKGVVYTKLGRDDGKVRRAKFGMFHQLDCQRRLRDVVLNGRWETEDVEDGYGSWQQCFDYLRQVVLCNADDSIETSRTNDGKWLFNGFGDGRQCRDASWLYSITSCGRVDVRVNLFTWERS